MSFSFINKIKYPRYTGSVGASNAILEVINELKEIGISDDLKSEHYFEVEEFDFLTSEASICELKLNDKIIESKPYGLSGSGKFSAKTIYIADGCDLSLYDLKGKIVMTNSRMTYDLYKDLIQRGALGFLSAYGSVYDTSNFIEDRALKERHLTNGSIPGMSIHIKDLEMLIKNDCPLVSFELESKNINKKAKNLIVTIKGEIEEEVHYTAHLDSYTEGVGAFDNATGCACLLSLINYYHKLKKRPYRTLKFLFLTGENQELLGSKNYLERHDIKNIKLNINIDLLGPYLGYDVSTATGDISICNYVDYLAKKLGLAVKTKQGVFFSSGCRYADKGIPTVSFARLSAQGGLQFFSTIDDSIFLSEESFLRSFNLILEFSNHIVEAINFPIPLYIPDTLKDKLDEFFQNKK